MDQPQQQTHDLQFEDEEIFCEDQSNAQEDEFDQMVGLLEEVLISDDFEQIQSEFTREKCKLFSASEDNKPEHIIIFKDYQRTLERHIEEQLKKQIPDFTLKSFLSQLQDKDIDEQILEMLLSFSDYQLFKEIMIEQRIRVEEEERTIKKKTNKAHQKGQSKQNNIFQPLSNDFQSLQITNHKQTGTAAQKPAKQFEEEMVEEGDLRPDLFLCVKALPTPKITKKK